MKNTILIIVLLSALAATKGFGQQTCTIYGKTATNLSYKWAHLYDPDTKTLLTVPVTLHQFGFKLDRPEKLKIVMLSFTTDSMKTYEEIRKSPDLQYPNGIRMVALEDTVNVTLAGYTPYATVKGRDLNKAIDGMLLSIKSINYGSFFDKYPDSPVAVVFLKTLADNVNKGWDYLSKAECKSFYDKLSANLKNSEEGKELLKMINK